MSRKDEIKIAVVLSEVTAHMKQDIEAATGQSWYPEGSDEWRRDVINPFAQMLAEDNPNFSYYKFLEAVEEGIADEAQEYDP